MGGSELGKHEPEARTSQHSVRDSENRTSAKVVAVEMEVMGKSLGARSQMNIVVNSM